MLKDCVMSKERLPKESKSQEIGHYAVLAFERWHPKDWRKTPTEGDSDVGIDYMMQVVSERQYKALFHVQVKGCRQKSEQGTNKRLSADETFYSQELEISTLNYYAAVDTPVMLVFADLVQNDDPRNCGVYYLWIDEELETLLDGHNDLSHLGKDSHTFHIPTSNILNDEVDVLPHFKKRLVKKRAMEDLFGQIAEQIPEPIGAVKELTSRFTNETILASVLLPTESPWIDAPPDSIAGGLHKTSDYLKMNSADSAKRELDKISARLKNAKRHERADYYYQLGRYNTLVGNLGLALENYQKAWNICPNIKKYRLAYLESKLNSNLDNRDVCQEILTEIEGDSEIEYIRLRAKALAFMRDRKSLDVLRSCEQKQVIVIKAVVYLLLGDYKNCKEVCDYALNLDSLEQPSRLTLYLLRARSLFCLGFVDTQLVDDEVIPFVGIPSMNDGILQQSWNDVVYAWDIGEELGYPTDLAYCIDMSCILGAYFRDVEKIYSRLQRFADIRPEWSQVQKGLLNIALYTHDSKTVNKQILRIGQTPDTVVYHILSEYDKKNRSRVVELTFENLAYLKETQQPNLDTVLLCAAECANELMDDDNRSNLLKEIQALSNGKDILVVYEFYETLNRSQLAKPEAVSRLYVHFEEGCEDKQVLAQLMQHLEPIEKESAEKLIRISNVIQIQRKLTWDELLNVCQALSVTENWSELLMLTENAFKRFGQQTRLIAIKAMALDAMGETPKALDLLESSIRAEIYDRFALEVYSNIWIRCGFVDKAQDIVAKMLERTEDNKQKLEFIRILFLLEMNMNPESPKLFSYCEKYGQLNNSEDEDEEGIYLQLVLLENLSTKRKPSEQHQKRLQAYTERFPNSRYLKAIVFRKDAPPEEILRQLDKVTGIDDSIREQYRRNETMLKSGQMIVPFPIRRNYLLNVCDLFHLWQISKIAGADNRQYLLTLEYGEYKCRPMEDILAKVPLIDEVSLLVLNDLGLLDNLFSIFKQVAIAKSTILRLQNWGQHAISAFSPIAKAITTKLREHIRAIYQPSCGKCDIKDISLPNLKEYEEIIQNNATLLFYSDDAPSRCLVYGDNYSKEGMTSLDLIEILRKHELISKLEAAKKIAILCSWNVGGIYVKYIDILRVISEDFRNYTGTEDPKTIIETLDINSDFNHFTNYIWDFDKPYTECLKDIANFVSLMILEESDFRIANRIIESIWYKWYLKVALKNRAESSKLAYLARSFWFISQITPHKITNQSRIKSASQKLWSIYKELVEFVFSDDMTDEIYNKSISLLAQFAVKTSLSIRDDVYNFIKMGLVDGTHDYNLFEKSYQDAAIRRDMKPR